jgi:hypothetical protein
VPDECNDDFTGPKSGSTPTATGAGAVKDLTRLPEAVVSQFIDPAHLGASHVASQSIASGAEIAVVGTEGSVAFWKYDKDQETLQLVATRGYPFKSGTLDTSDLTVSASVLSGMTHATFIIRGTFSTDGTGNAVAYTYNVPKKTWGAIKAETRTSLKVTNQGVGVGGIGLSQDFQFVDGRLETDDCSSTVPAAQCGPGTLVTKYWEWDGTHFILYGTAGLPK